MELVTTQAAMQAGIDAMKRALGYPPNRMRVGIDLAKELFQMVATQTKETEAGFLAAIEKGEVVFNGMTLEAGWV